MDSRPSVSKSVFVVGEAPGEAKEKILKMKRKADWNVSRR
jgi:hypothetical protein